MVTEHGGTPHAHANELDLISADMELGIPVPAVDLQKHCMQLCMQAFRGLEPAQDASDTETQAMACVHMSESAGFPKKLALLYSSSCMHAAGFQN